MPTKARPEQRDVGTWRFHNDGPITDRRVPVLGRRTTTTDSPPVADEREQRGLFAA
ncbi:hypothetical protein [Streptomyces sp. NPDC012450]|uniref:hypothetical protein n=1 Tax=Streptomyces sp. NPDC012450 TaxID=3364834 RepID=UPI0036E379DF